MAYGADNLRSLAGIAIIAGICWLFSENRSRFPFRLAIGALALQAGLVFLMFGLPGARGPLTAICNAVNGALGGDRMPGTQFVFGYLAGGAQPYRGAGPERAVSPSRSRSCRSSS